MKIVHALLLALAVLGPLAAQTSSLHGQVTDESGAFVIGAQVVLKGPGEALKTTRSGSDGSYSF
ncbi:MAG: carboxypeptidase-like regulatory domain-containing protein, partial [Bryobacteraceae bacterium]